MTPGSSSALLLSLIAVTLLIRCGCTDIIGGREVRPHSWPYMVALWNKNCRCFLWRSSCGKTMGSDSSALSVSVLKWGNFYSSLKWGMVCKPVTEERIDKLEDRAVLGAHRASVAEKEQQIFEIMETFPHSQYNKNPHDNDIMLLKLNGAAKLNKYVQPLSLPESFEDVEAGTVCQVAGWGDASRGKPSKYLQKATLKIVDRKSCDKQYDNCPKITKTMLCATGKSKFHQSDTCEGDSGGPLICAGQYRGIVSFGKKCGKTGIPGVYTRLTEEYIDWIKRIISSDRDP